MKILNVFLTRNRIFFFLIKLPVLFLLFSEHLILDMFFISVFQRSFEIKLLLREHGNAFNAFTLFA